MKTIDRYIAKETLKIFIMALIAFVAAFLLVDFFERIDNIVEAKAGPGVAIRYFLLKLPFVTILGIPASILLASVVSLGMLNRFKELIALQASGVSLFAIARPVLGVGLVASLFSFAFAEVVVPQATRRANELWDQKVEKLPPRIGSKAEKVWIKSGGNLLKIGAVHSEEGFLQGVTLFRFDENFRLKQWVGAKSGVWDGTGWRLLKGTVLDVKERGDYAVRKFDTAGLGLKEKPRELLRYEKKAEEMTFRDLSRYIERLETEGYDAARYRVDLLSKTSFPFTPLVMALIAIPFGMRREGARGLAFAVGAACAISFVYLTVFHFSLSLGRMGVLPPLLAAWLANTAFCLAGGYLFLKTLTR